ncbi:MAG: pyridoxal-phosphate dependent enzyme [Ilumatobacteraceae bacterium]
MDVDVEAIRRARAVIPEIVRVTPVVPSGTLTDTVGGVVVLKAENLQRTGSFKIRGAMNTLASLGVRARAGVTCGSAGNHAQALALAAAHHGVPCEIFVPTGAPISKIDACRSFGATVTEVGASLSEAVRESLDLADARDMAFCHPYDDPIVVAGQGTLGLELLDDIADLATVVVPLGGGGLAAGTAIAVKSVLPHARVIGVQAAACAPYAGQPAPEGPIVTLADGIAVKSPGEVTRPLVERWLDDVVTVDEDAIADAMVLLMERTKLYVEGAGAVGAAALLSGAVAPAASGTTCVVLSGGNVDLGVVPGLIRRHENESGRRLMVFARIDDRPGGLATLLAVFADGGANLIEVEHVREGIDLHVRETGVHATFEVRGRDHAQRLLDAAADAGYHLRAEGP